MDKSCFIRHGWLVDPATGRDGLYDIRIEDGRIKEVGESLSPAPGEEVVDATGLHVFPGFVDLHVHLREPGQEYKETIATGTLAAAAGGYTTVCPMANTKPPIDRPERLAAYLKRIEETALVHVIPVGAVTLEMEGKTLCDYKTMAQMGMKAISEDGKSVMKSTLYQQAMEEAAKNDLVILAHCEEIDLVAGGVMHKGKRAEELQLPGISSGVENIITARDIFLAQETGAKLHLCHCSTKESVELVKLGKKFHVQVSAEVCPHHFTLCEEDIPGDDGAYKMNPPLRTKEDRQALREGLLSNVMETIATDHAPHAPAEKEGSMKKAAFGIVGLETAFPLSYTELVRKEKMPLSQLIRQMSQAPAEILGLSEGSLAEGKKADLVLVNLQESYSIAPEDFKGKNHNTPFLGYSVWGRIMQTMVEGNWVYKREGR